MKKRGQVTVFIIVGLVLLLLTSAIFLLTRDVLVNEFSSDGTFSEADSVKLFIEDCLEETGKRGLDYLGLQGGYYKTPEPVEHYSHLSVPYYFYRGKKYLPELSEIENQLSLYLQDYLPKCLDYSSYEQQGYQIASGELKVKSIISERNVLVTLHYPLSLRLGEKNRQFQSFSTVLNLDFQDIYSLVQEIMAEQEESPSVLNLGFLSDLAEENQFQYVLTSVSPKSSLFNLLFNFTGREYYNFVFLLNYQVTPATAEMEEENESIIIYPPQLEIKGPKQNQKLSFGSFMPLVAAQELPPAGEDLSFDWNNPGQIQGLTDYNLLHSISSREIQNLLNYPAVLAEFELRLSQPNFVQELNLNRVALNKWASLKGISFGEFGQLESYQNGLIKTKGAESVLFDPSLVPGALVLVSGGLQLADGSVVMGAEIKQGTSYVEIQGGSLDLSLSSHKSQLQFLVKETSIKKDNLELFAEKGIQLVVEVANGQPRISGRKGQIKFQKGLVANFDGTVFLENDRLIFEEGTKWKSFHPCGNPVGCVSSYEVKKNDVAFMLGGNSCGSFKNCLEIDNLGVRLTASLDDAKVEIDTLSEAIKTVQVLPIRNGKLTYNLDDQGKLIFTDKPVRMEGDLSTLNIYVEGEYLSRGVRKTLTLNPSKSGVEVFECMQRCVYRGKLTNEILVSLASIQKVKKKENEISEELGLRYGGRNALKVLSYLDEPREARIIQAIKSSAREQELDENFVAGTFFVEGLHLWIEGQYYENSNAEIAAFSSLGADRFGKEVDELREEGYLPDGFRTGDNFHYEGTVTGERREEFPRVVFNNIESGIRGATAMLNRRQDLVLRDLQKLGVDPGQLSPEEINFWTYVYWNAGSGPPEDSYGKGRAILKRYVAKGRSGLKIPSEVIEDRVITGDEVFVDPRGNAQRVMSTTKLIEMANKPLPEAAVSALK